MISLKFEYRITLAYLLIGSMWIIFSDKLLKSIIDNIDLLTQIQTYKGWFYVLITALLFFLFLKKHLNRLRLTERELEKHKNNLENLVEEKTKKLDVIIEKHRAANDELSIKNGIINSQNVELKEALCHLEETQSQLFQVEKMASLGVLTAGVAHEINNPLNYILGGLTGLENYLDTEKKQNDKINLFLKSIKTGVDRASAIVSGLEKFSRNKENYEEDCEMNGIIENCLAILNSQLKNRIKVLKNYSGNNLIVSGNSGELHQVIINILANACQSIDNEGTISITTGKVDKEITIKIEDTGCGIPNDHMAKIADPFFTTREPGKGIGLGLSVAYNIIKAHKGEISFHSEINIGTVVYIVLPVKNS
jgi:C4-dicarboxylate-specific signal transduction histidine kinase